jgi:hypothetical protein
MPDNNYQERSPLWGFTAGAALLGGAGVGLYRAHPALRGLFTTMPRDIAGEVAARVPGMGGFNLQRTIKSTVDTSDLAIHELSKIGPGGKVLQHDIAAAAYEAIMAGGRYSEEEAYTAFQNIMGQSTYKKAYGQAAAEIQDLLGDADVFAGRLRSLTADPTLGGRTPWAARAEAAISPGEFVGTTIDRPVKPIQDFPKAVAIQERLDEAMRKAGGEIDWRGVEMVREALGGGKFAEVPVLRAAIGREAINIPLEGAGMAYGGQRLTARYRTRRAYGETGAIRNYADEYVDLLANAISRQKTTTGVKNTVIEINHRIIEALHDRDASHRAMAVWSLPEAVLPSGGRARARMLGQQAVYAGKMTEELRGKMVEEAAAGGRQLWPVGGPDPVARGVFMAGVHERMTPAEELYGPLGRLVGTEQQPFQFIRGEWGVTAEAKAKATPFAGTFGEYYSRLERKIQGPAYQRMVHGGHAATAAEAYTAPQLVTFYAKTANEKQALQRGMVEGNFLAEELNKRMFLEEGLIAEQAADMMEYERVVAKKINLREGLRVNEEILAKLKGARIGEVREFATPIGQEGFIGVERHTGAPLWAEAQAGGEAAEVIAAELTDDHAATVYVRERHRIGRDKWWKFFSEDIKFMGRAQTQKELAGMLGVAGAPTEIGGQAVQAMWSGKLVQRNLMAQLTQQMEAMSLITAGKIDAGTLAGSEAVARSFLEDPARIMGVSSLNAATADRAVFDLQRRMTRTAKRFGFTAEEMGLTFGLMDQGVADSLGIGQAVADSTGVMGLMKGRLGDLAAEGGAGGMATIEQAGMRLLAMKGAEGQALAAELGTRAYGKTDLVAANRMMGTVLGEEGLVERWTGDIPTAEKTLAQMTQEDLRRAQGRYVPLGQDIEALGGAKRLYVPGFEEAPELMQQFRAQGGRMIDTDVMQELQNLRYQLARGAATEEIEAAAASLRSKVVAATERQATIAKGKLLGTRYLTGVRQTAEQTAQAAGAFRVSPRTAQRMMDELLENAKTDDQRELLKFQKEMLLKKNQAVVAGVWRHPLTGPESFQFARFQVDRNLADELIASPYQEGSLTIGGVQRQVDISPMVGMKGDFDKDAFSIAAISDRDTFNRLTRKMDSEIAEGYTSYLFNHYAMKDLIKSQAAKLGGVKGIAEMTRREAMMQGAANLTTAKIATPQVNIALQKAKLGLQYAAPEKYRPMAELFWHLEEAAIGGKHGAYQSQMYQDIAHAIQQQDASGMESVLKRIMGEEDRVVSGSITNPVTGREGARTLKFSPRQAAEDIISGVRAVGADVDVAVKEAQLAKGRVPDDLNTLIHMYYKRRTGSLDVAQAVMQRQAYGQPSLTENATRALRMAKTRTSAVFGALRHARAPLMIGASLAAGVMLAAPSVSGSLSAPKEGAAGGRNLGDDYIGPAAGQGMSPPTARIMQSPKVYDMSGMRSASRASIRIPTPDANQMGQNFMRQAGDLGGRTRIRTVDNREALSPQRLANRIHERL